MRRVIEYIKERYSQEEIAELVKELSAKDETKENTLPKTWEEYIGTLNKGYFIDCNSSIVEVLQIGNANVSRNTLPTKELAEGFRAMMQLMSLRQAWIGEWKPDWTNSAIEKWFIHFVSNDIRIDYYHTFRAPLSFPTQEMAEEFLKCFKNLIEKAKVLI